MRADLALAIAQLRRHEQPALAADPHAHQPDVPTLDHPTGADHALEGFAACVGAVEQRAVSQRYAGLGGGSRYLDQRDRKSVGWGKSVSDRWSICWTSFA